MKKKRPRSYGADRAYLNVASSCEMTGAVPTPPLSRSQQEAYGDVNAGSGKPGKQDK